MPRTYMQFLNSDQLAVQAGSGTNSFYRSASIDATQEEMRKAFAAKDWRTFQIARSYFKLKTISESEALEALTGKGDYSSSQARIILGHARKYRLAGNTVYSREYIETRIKA